MRHHDESDPAMDELLRSTFAAEADTVVPRGDGLARIQQQIGARRSRRAWLVPAAALASTLVVAGAAYGAYSVTHHPSSNDDQTVNTATTTPSTPVSTPTVTPTAKVASVAFPGSAFYPFTSAQQEQAWEAGGKVTQPWATDAAKTAQHFVTDFVGEPDAAIVVSRALGTTRSTVTLGRTAPEGSGTRGVTVVHLERFRRAWVVTSADDAGGLLKVSAPARGAALRSPVTATGPAYGVDEAAVVTIRTVSGIVATGNTGSFGAGVKTWSAKLSWAAASAPRGALVVTESSGAGGPGRIVAVPVSFPTSSVQPYPAYFYGIKDGRVTKYAARDGASLQYLTPAQAGGGASDPQRDADAVYYLTGSGTCANALMSVATSGGPSTQVAMSTDGYVITGYGVHGRDTALYETACDSATTPQAKLVLTSPIDDTNTSTSTIAYDSVPPGVVGDPAWEPDGAHVDVVLRTGNQAHVQRYAFDASEASSGTSTCGASLDGLPQAVAVDAGGAVWVASQTGNGTTVSRCTAGSVSTAFSVAGIATPHDLAVSADGSAVLVTDGAGALYRWSAADGQITQLHPRVPQPDVSW